MKYAKFSDDFLSDFRLDDNGETLVLTDKRGYSRAVKLLTYEEKPQGDLISRSYLKQTIPAPIEDEYKYVHQIIDNAPSVDISKEVWNMSNELLNKRLSYLGRPQGEWIKNEHTFWTCSHCNWFNEMNRIKYNFCPCCGAKMEGGAK